LALSQLLPVAVVVLTQAVQPIQADLAVVLAITHTLAAARLVKVILVVLVLLAVAGPVAAAAVLAELVAVQVVVTAVDKTVVQEQQTQ
jgi:hypothetical protein